MQRPPLSEPRRRRLTLLAMCVATFMIQLDVTIVGVALPSIQRDLHVTPGALEWVISGYALSLAALIPVSGALGDRYGRRRIFLAGVVVFAIGSAACALSPSESVLVACRVLQGAGGAAMLALTLSIIAETFPPETRAAAIGTWAAVGGRRTSAEPASTPSREPSASPTGSLPPSHSCTATTSPSGSGQPACSRRPSSPSSGSAGRPDRPRAALAYVRIA